MRTFTVRDSHTTRSYTGFNRKLEDAKRIALVFISGETDIYAVDDQAEFERYLKDRGEMHAIQYYIADKGLV